MIATSGEQSQQIRVDRSLTGPCTRNKVLLLQLVCEGLELQDAGTFQDFYVQQLSTIRMVLLGRNTGSQQDVSLSAAGGQQPPPAAGASDAQTAEDFSVVSEGEMPRALVLTGLPEADAPTTEKAIFDAFSAYGPIARIIFQTAGGSGSGSDGHGQQHAVIVFHRDASAAASLAADNTVIMGAPVRVVLASSLAPPPPPPGSSTGDQNAAAGVQIRRPTLASYAVADMLAQGYLYGVQGVAHLKRFDAQHGLSSRISVVADTARARADDINRQYHVTQTVQTTYELAKAQALELDHRYQISNNVDAAARAALTKAAALASRAMADPRIALTVTSAKSFISQAASVAGELIQQARVDVRNIETRVQRQAQYAQGSVLAQPAQPAAAFPQPQQAEASDGQQQGQQATATLDLD